MNHVTHPLNSADISIFFTGNQQILLRNADIDCILIHNI